MLESGTGHLYGLAQIASAVADSTPLEADSSTVTGRVFVAVSVALFRDITK
jgi:hypothetical protein